MTRGRVEPKDVAADRRAAEVRKLSTLVEISQALAGTLDLRPGLHRALELLEQHHSVVNAAVTLRDEENGDLDVVAVESARARRAAQRRQRQQQRRQRRRRQGDARSITSPIR